MIPKKIMEENSAIITLDIDAMWDFRINEVEKIKANLWNLFAIPEAKSKEFFAKTDIKGICKK